MPADHKTPPNPRGQQDPRPDHNPQPASQPLVQGAKRPLSVLSAIYVAWSGIRLRDCLVWQEKWVHRNAFAFRPQKSALDAATLLAPLIERAHLLRQALSGAGTDYMKCFDLIPQQISFRMAREFGLDPKPQAALEAMYQQLHRAFKINGALGSFFHATNGVLQGCAMSVLMINMLTTVWMRAMDERHEDLRLGD